MRKNPNPDRCRDAYIAGRNKPWNGMCMNCRGPSTTRKRYTKSLDYGSTALGYGNYLRRVYLCDDCVPKFIERVEQAEKSSPGSYREVYVKEARN